MRMPTLAALGLLSLVPPGLAADGVTGHFTFGQTKVVPKDGFAYTAEDGTLTVLVADFPIHRQTVLDAIETPNGLLEQVLRLEGKGNMLAMRMLPGDKCSMFAYLNGDQSISLSESFRGKPGKAPAGRVVGQCATAEPGKMFDDAYEWSLAFDLPLTPVPPSTPLGPGGGEPGADYLALVKAIQAADWKTASLRLREDEVPPTPPAAADMKDYFHGLGLNYPHTATVVSGRVKGQRALLEIEGTNYEKRKLKGRVGLVKKAAVWRVSEQGMYYAE
jgi:hypothetical protein